MQPIDNHLDFSNQAFSNDGYNLWQSPEKGQKYIEKNIRQKFSDTLEFLAETLLGRKNMVDPLTSFIHQLSQPCKPVNRPLKHNPGVHFPSIRNFLQQNPSVSLADFLQECKNYPAFTFEQEDPDLPGYRMLQVAIRVGNLPIALHIIENCGLEFIESDAGLHAPLTLALAGKNFWLIVTGLHPPLISPGTCEENALPIVKKMLKKGANINIPLSKIVSQYGGIIIDEVEITALQIAAMRTDYKLIRYLIKHGAKLSQNVSSDEIRNIGQAYKQLFNIKDFYPTFKLLHSLLKDAPSLSNDVGNLIKSVFIRIFLKQPAPTPKEECIIC